MVVTPPGVQRTRQAQGQPRMPAAQSRTFHHRSAGAPNTCVLVRCRRTSTRHLDGRHQGNYKLTLMTRFKSSIFLATEEMQIKTIFDPVKTLNHQGVFFFLYRNNFGKIPPRRGTCTHTLLVNATTLFRKQPAVLSKVPLATHKTKCLRLMAQPVTLEKKI